MYVVNRKLNHPLQLGTQIKTKVPTCPCRGTKWTEKIGVIKRVKQRQKGVIKKYVYILHTGHRIEQDWVHEIL